ncbi:MAG TPA: phosphomannomutase/phosphoglucomutase [Candidatus Gracilibacteria bacterium]|nr:phosphomannomutase/phosphoglucomutase [Candidatus Gracilibacteria bacterium]
MTKINPHIFRAYDIRGIATATDKYPTPDLTEETVYLIGKGTATHLIRKYNSRHMAVGRDIRLTGPSLQQAFIKGCLECGLDVTDIGPSPSPMIYFATCAHQYEELAPFDCATNITASHNPKEYNGIKTVALNAHSICGDELQEILQLIEAGDFEIPGTPNANNAAQGKLSEANIWPLYLKELSSKLHTENKQLPQIDNQNPRKLKVVIDAGNGVAGPFAPELLRQIGAEVIELYCDPDGTFPHHEANPEELENMHDLITKVISEKADLGIGFDGDADRIGIIDEKGNHYSSDFLLLLLTKDLLARNEAQAQSRTQTTQLANTPTKPKIVFDVKVSQAIINKMAELGAEPTMSKTGHSFIEKRMKEVNAPLAGEVSGHLFFAENYYGYDDAFLAAVKILEILANENSHTDPSQNRPFSALFNDLPKTYMTPEFKAHTPDDKKFEIVASLVAHFTSLYDCITLDGVRVKFDAISWAAVRASNTSPNLTLRFEADTPEKLADIQKIMVDELKKHPEVDLSWYKA